MVDPPHAPVLAGPMGAGVIAGLAADPIADAHSPAHVVSTLGPFLTEARREKIEQLLRGRVTGLQVAIEAPSDPHNAAAVVRTAEALGVLGVHMVQAEGALIEPALHKRATTQGAFSWVQTHHHPDLQSLLTSLRAAGVALWGAAVDGPVPLGRIPVDAPVCVLLGNETRGLSAEARTACDGLFHIPMVGMSESLNLSVSAALCMHDVLRRRGGGGDLTVAQRELWRARYYARCVDARLLGATLGTDSGEGAGAEPTQEGAR